MSKFFQHTPQKIGSTTSPTSDLALEVSEAFHKVEGLLDTEGTSLISFKDALGNALFSSIKPHKVTAELSETHTLLENESDIVLENKVPHKWVLLENNIAAKPNNMLTRKIQSKIVKLISGTNGML